MAVVSGGAGLEPWLRAELLVIPDWSQAPLS